jgi:two-component system, OmpR family, sensor kinase
MNMSLRLRLTLLTGLLTGGAILLFALVFYLVLQDNLFEEMDARLYERADLVRRMLVEDADAAAGTAHIPPLVEFDSPGIYVELVGADGTVRVSSPNLIHGRLPTDPTLDAAARAGRSEIGTITAGGDEQLRLLVMPAESGDILVVAESLEPLERTLTQARTLLIGCGALALVLVTSSAALLTGRALASIRQLTKAAATIATTGHYQERVLSTEHHDEIGQLALTINGLIATVERTLGQQRQFLADTSHELRSPLTVVLANLNLLRRNMEQTERDVCIEEATVEAQRMRRLVNDLLLLARRDAAQSMERTELWFDRLVKETVTLAARQMPEYPFDVQVERPIAIVGDHERLTQLLRNLLENAAHHTPPGTAINVHLSRVEHMAQLMVADMGSGIAAEHLPYIWDRFYRVDKARSRTFGGTGLGLAIVKYIAEAHRGDVSVVSAPGKGTTFTIRLPLTTNTAQIGLAIGETAASTTHPAAE